MNGGSHKVLKAQQTCLASQATKNEISILPDSRIKECKEAFIPRTQSGQIGWVALCKEYLTGRLLKDWEVISGDLSLNSIDMSADYDLAYAVLADEKGKTIFIPDGLYQRKIKRLKFP